MKIVVTGSLGHISKPLTRELVQKGHQVTVVSTNPAKQKDIDALGAAAAIGSVADGPFLSNTFKGADIVYTMFPPINFFDHSVDISGYAPRIMNSYCQSIRQTGIKRVIHLSSIGAHMDEDSGLILSHHEAEKSLSELKDVTVTFMRPTAFYYNLLAFIPVIKAAGCIASNYGGEDIVPWVAPVDIAAAIAEEVESPKATKKIRYVASEELSCQRIARILGAAIGKPDLEWKVISDEQMQTNLVSAGMPAEIATGLVVMNARVHDGRLSEDYFRHRPAVMGKTKMKEFAKEFARIYDQK